MRLHWSPGLVLYVIRRNVTMEPDKVWVDELDDIYASWWQRFFARWFGKKIYIGDDHDMYLWRGVFFVGRKR